MRLNCPYCGTRSVNEFVPLGSASPKRPTLAEPIERWIDYVYFRDNIAGEHDEYFYHAMGCRSWLIVTRNTVTHEIFGTKIAREVAA